MTRSIPAALALFALGLGSCSESPAPVAAAGPANESDSTAAVSTEAGAPAGEFRQAPLAEAPVLAGRVTFGGELATLEEGTVMVMASSDLGAMMARRFDLAPESPEYGPGRDESGLPFRLGELDNISGQRDLGGHWSLRVYYDRDGDAGTMDDMARGSVEADAGDVAISLELDGPLGEGGFGGHDMLGTTPELPAAHPALPELPSGHPPLGQ